MRWKFLIAVLVATTFATPAVGRADTATGVRASEEPVVTVKPKTEQPTKAIVVVEDLIVTLPATIYYWRTPNEQKADWYYHWDWPSWRAKLTSLSPIVLDTNKFEANAIRHPMVGALTYQIGRANGWSPAKSLVLDLLTSVAWEYVVEYKEQPSINDMFSNTAGGILIGEPLFRIAETADDRPSAARRTLALLVAPFHRAQRETALSPLAVEVAEPNRLEVFGGGELVRATDAVDGNTQAKVGLDLEVFADRSYGEPGADTHWTGFGTWNRVTGDLFLGGPIGGVSGGDFRSSTTWGGLFARRLDDGGRGAQYFAGLGSTFDVVDRRLPAEWDKYATFQLVQPRAAAWVHTPYGDVDVEASTSADVAMVTAHARAMDPRVPDSSIVLSQGYYYATGISAQARARARRGRWSAEVEGIAHQFWSFDEHTHGGADDPRDLADGRLIATAVVGVRPFADKTMRVELFGQHTTRRGTGDNLFRETRELDTGIAVRAAF